MFTDAVGQDLERTEQGGIHLHVMSHLGTLSED